jgi:hypothetical protein
MHRLVVLGALLAVTVGMMVGRRALWNIDSAQLGYVSGLWLTEYRASHLS